MDSFKTEVAPENWKLAMDRLTVNHPFIVPAVCKTFEQCSDAYAANGRKVRTADLPSRKMLRVARMAGLVKLSCSAGHLTDRQQTAEAWGTVRSLWLDSAALPQVGFRALRRHSGTA